MAFENVASIGLIGHRIELEKSRMDLALGLKLNMTFAGSRFYVKAICHLKQANRLIGTRLHFSDLMSRMIVKGVDG